MKRRRAARCRVRGGARGGPPVPHRLLTASWGSPARHSRARGPLRGIHEPVAPRSMCAAPGTFHPLPVPPESLGGTARLAPDQHPGGGPARPSRARAGVPCAGPGPHGESAVGALLPIPHLEHTAAGRPTPATARGAGPTGASSAELSGETPERCMQLAEGCTRQTATCLARLGPRDATWCRSRRGRATPAPWSAAAHAGCFWTEMGPRTKTGGSA